MDSARKSVVAVICTVLIVLAVSITYGLVASTRAPATNNQANYGTSSTYGATGYTTPYGTQTNYGPYENPVNSGYGYGGYGYGGMMGGGMMGGYYGGNEGYGSYGGYGGYGMGMP